jgi:hypothetical protein
MARGFEVTTGLVIQQGLFEESTTAKHKIGTRMQLADGRVYYYAGTGEATEAGHLAYSKPTHAAKTAMVGGIAAAIGAKSISGFTVGTNAFVANEFAEGWLVVQKVAGTGYTYKIKSNTSGSAAGTASVVLYDPVQVAITTLSEINFVYNPFYAVLTASAVVTSSPAGVPAKGVITSGSYGWLQTWGVCGVQHDEAGSLTIGMRVHSSTEQGAVTGYTTSTETTGGGKIYPDVGHNYGQVAVDAEWTPIVLRLYP